MLRKSSFYNKIPNRLSGDIQVSGFTTSASRRPCRQNMRETGAAVEKCPESPNMMTSGKYIPPRLGSHGR
jgi:hypothetical protein